MKSREEIEALLLDVLPALPAELLADGDTLREHLGVFPSTGELVDELAATLSLLHAHAPEAPELSADFADRVMAALPAEAPAPAAGGLTGRGPAASGPALTGGGDFSNQRWVWRAVAAAACFALGVGFARWQAPTHTLTAQQAVTPPNPGELAPNLPPATSPADTDGYSAPWGEPAQGGSLAQDPGWGQGGPAPGSEPAWGEGRVTYAGNPVLGEYASRAQAVLQTLDEFEAQPDPQALRELVLTVRTNKLVLRGEALLAELEVSPERPERLAQLIHGTQVILRRVRNARGPAAVTVVSTLREEVRTTGLLDAYDTLLTPHAEPAPNPSPPIKSTEPL